MCLISEHLYTAICNTNSLYYTILQSGKVLCIPCRPSFFLCILVSLYDVFACISLSLFSYYCIYVLTHAAIWCNISSIEKRTTFYKQAYTYKNCETAEVIISEFPIYSLDMCIRPKLQDLGVYVKTHRLEKYRTRKVVLHAASLNKSDFSNSCALTRFPLTAHRAVPLR